MKNLFTFLAAVFIAAGVFAQTPEKISYQAVIRNSSNQLVTNQQVGMQISILQSSPNGTAVYVETQTPNTNANGLVSIEIGGGTVVSGNFAAIDWANGPYFIQSETDPTGGTNYTITGTSQLLSVPYALHAKTAESVTGEIAETDPVFSAWDKNYNDLVNKPDLAKVATSGNYSDLTNQPSIPEVYNSTVTFNGTAVGSSPQTIRLNQSGNKTITINQADISGFITTETDPEFTNSEAAKITADDITNLGNLSGINTGDQDLTTLATKIALADSTAKVRSEIPDVSGFLSSETDPVWLADSSVIRAQIRAEISDSLSTLNSELFTVLKDTAAQIRADIPDVSSFITAETDPSVPVGTQPGQMQYWNGTAWITVAAGNEGQVLTFVSGVPTWKTKLKDGEVENLTTGKVWMDRNLGASHVAISSTDAIAYGSLYQWGRAADGHQNRTSSTIGFLATSDTPGHIMFIITSTSPYDWLSTQNPNLWQGVSGTNNPCPIGYRLPTEAEWDAERQSWSSNNAAGAFASSLKLPVAGCRSYNGSVKDEGSDGLYWSSTVDGTNSRYLYFSSGSAGMGSDFRAAGFTVRCIKD